LEKQLKERLKSYPVYKRELRDLLLEAERLRLRDKPVDPFLLDLIGDLKKEMTAIKNDYFLSYTKQYPPQLRRRILREHLFFKYRYLDGLTLEEVAEKLNISRTSVYRLSAALGCRRCDDQSLTDTPY